jgi:acetyltransferase-like isoleucine patch superfamily enzyme
MDKKSFLFPIIPGEAIPGDWFPGKIPFNISVGENSVIDSSFCFKQYFSGLTPGLIIGSNVTIWRASLAAEENAIIEIGDYSYLSSCAIVCSKKVRIGNRVFIAGGVTIADSDFHPLNPAERLADIIALSPTGNRAKRPMVPAIPVVIEDDVWIGYNATILKGVHIGKGAYISPGALVLDNVASGATVSGNPAKSLSA